MIDFIRATTLVVLLFTRSSQTTSVYTLTQTNITDFTSFYECSIRYPTSDLINVDETGIPHDLTSLKACVLGIAPRFKTSTPSDSELQYFESLLSFISPQLGTSYYVFNSTDVMNLAASHFYIWAGIVLDTSALFELSSIPNLTIPVPYSIKMSSSLLPFGGYLDKEPNIFFSMVANYLANGARKFDYSGFSWVQQAVERGIINYKLNLQASYGSMNSKQPTADAGNQWLNATNMQIWTSPFSAPISNIPLVILLSASLLNLAYIPSIILCCYDLVNERTSLIKNYLKSMGMSENAYFISWFSYVFVSIFITSTIIFTGSALFGLMSGIVWQAILLTLLFCFSLTALVFLIAPLSKSKQVATVYIISIMALVPNVLAVFLTNSTLYTKSFFSLASPVAFVFSIVECLKSHIIESDRLAIIPDELEALGSYSLIFGYVVLIFDTLLYFLLGWYFHNTYTKDNPRPYYFLFTKHYWFPESDDEAGATQHSTLPPLPKEIDMYEMAEVSSLHNPNSSSINGIDTRVPPIPTQADRMPYYDSAEAEIPMTARDAAPKMAFITEIKEHPRMSMTIGDPRNFEPLLPEVDGEVQELPSPHARQFLRSTSISITQPGTHSLSSSSEIPPIEGKTSEEASQVKTTKASQKIPVPSLSLPNQNMNNRQSFKPSFSRSSSNLLIEGMKLRNSSGQVLKKTKPTANGIGVRMKNVTKAFPSIHGEPEKAKAAIVSLSVEAARNQVLVFVGDAGSGKTTLISMLAGLIPVTDGVVEIEHFNIQYERSSVRQVLSLVPCEPMLLSNLTVLQHISLFVGLRMQSMGGDQKSSVPFTNRVDIEDILTSLKLWESRNKRAGQLNWIEQKKTCLAIAIAVDSKVLLLDEPTLGMDPESRMDIWDIIRDHKEGRTIILTTNAMEEADALGDRIALLNRGRLVACGTPTFLKRRFGAGYYLNLTKTPDSDPRMIAKFIQDRIKGAKLVLPPSGQNAGLWNNRTQLKFTLPFSAQPQYPDLFQDMETQIEAHSLLGIESFAVSLTTLEDVLTEVNQQLDQKTNTISKTKITNASTLVSENQNPELGGSADSLHSSTYLDVGSFKSKDVLPNPRKNKQAPWLQQMKIVLLSRLKIHSRRYSMIAFWILVPLITIFLIWLSSILGSDSVQLPQILNGSSTSADQIPVPLNFSMMLPIQVPYYQYMSSSKRSLDYVDTDSLIVRSVSQDNIGTFLESSWINDTLLSYQSIPTMNELSDYLWTSGNPSHRYFAWTTSQFALHNPCIELGLLYNSTEAYSLPISINLFFNTLLTHYMLMNGSTSMMKREFRIFDMESMLSVSSSLTSQDIMKTIQLTSEPFEPIPGIQLFAITFDRKLMSSFILFDQAWSLGLALCLSILLAVITRDIVTERVSKIRFQQQIMGLASHNYWLSNFIIDFLRLLIALIVIILAGVSFQLKNLFGVYLGTFVILLILLVPVLLMMAYVMSRFFHIPKTCYKWILLIYSLMFIIPYILMFIVQVSRLVILSSTSNIFSPFVSFILGYSSFLSPFSSFNGAIFDIAIIQREDEALGTHSSFSTLTSWSLIGRHYFALSMHFLVWSMLLYFFALSPRGDSYRRKPRSSVKPSRSDTSDLALDFIADDESNTGIGEKRVDEDTARQQDLLELGSGDVDVMKERNRIIGGEYENAAVRVNNLTKRQSRGSAIWHFIAHFILRRKADQIFFDDISEEANQIKSMSFEGRTVNGIEENLNITQIGSTYFAVPPGETFGILGPKGSGKSTLLGMLVGDIPPSGGDVEINGHSIYGYQDTFFRNARLSYSPSGQTLSLFDDLTVREHLELWFSLRNEVMTYELATMVDYTLNKMDLMASQQKLCKHLSQSTRRKLSVALVLFTGNHVVFLDEPTKGMNPKSKRKMWKMLHEVREETGVAIVIATDNIKEAELACTKYGILVQGQFQCLGSNEYLSNRFEEGYYLQVVKASSSSSTNYILHSPSASAMATRLSASNETNTSSVSSSSSQNPTSALTLSASTGSFKSPSNLQSDPQLRQSCNSNKRSNSSMDDSDDNGMIPLEFPIPSGSASTNDKNKLTDSLSVKSGSSATIGGTITQYFTNSIYTKSKSLSNLSLFKTKDKKYDDDFTEFTEFVDENFRGARLLTAYGTHRTYFLGPLDSLAWAFDLLETNKQRFGILEYSLSQTTLSEVFLQFSKNQRL